MLGCVEPDANSMPHATGTQRSLDDHDDFLIGALLNPADPTQQTSLNFDRELELGEKADDAVDYEEISDNDLADDDGDDSSQAQQPQQGQLNQRINISGDLEDFLHNAKLSNLPNANGDASDDIDDLFGDDPLPVLEASKDPVHVEHGLGGPDNLFDTLDDSEVTVVHSRLHPSSGIRNPFAAPSISSYNPDALGAPPSKEQQLQQQLFAMSRIGQDTLPAPPENQEELLASLWPKFQRDTVPRFIDLLPPKKARYVGKVPKSPKPVNPNKLNLELAQDQERNFKMWSSIKQDMSEERRLHGLVCIEQDITDEYAREESFELSPELEEDVLGGISWQDLQIICADWDISSMAESQASEYQYSRRVDSNVTKSSMYANSVDEYCLDMPLLKVS